MDVFKPSTRSYDGRMFDIGCLLVNRAIIDLYTREPVSENHRGYRPISARAGWALVRGEPQPTLAYETSVVRIPNGFIAPWSRQAASDNLVARVRFDPPDERDVLGVRARSFDERIISEGRFEDLVERSARAYGIPITLERPQPR